MGLAHGWSERLIKVALVGECSEEQIGDKLREWDSVSDVFKESIYKAMDRHADYYIKWYCEHNAMEKESHFRDSYERYIGERNSSKT